MSDKKDNGDGKITPYQDRMTAIYNAIQNRQDEIERAIPETLRRHLTPERIMRVAWSSIQRNRELSKAHPLSIANAIIQASELGLEPNNILGHAYLVPFRSKDLPAPWEYECQMIPGYMGKVEIARRSGQISTIYAEVVRENDEFNYQLGDSPIITHRPLLSSERGKMIAVYAVAIMKDGTKQRVVMETWQVELRKQVAKTKKVWDAWPEEMWKKTALHQLWKLLPKTPEMRDLEEHELQHEADLAPTAATPDELPPAAASLDDLIDDADVEDVEAEPEDGGLAVGMEVEVIHPTTKEPVAGKIAKIDGASILVLPAGAKLSVRVPRGDVTPLPAEVTEEPAQGQEA